MEPEEQEEEYEEEEEEEDEDEEQDEGSDGGDEADMGDSEVDEDELEMEKAALLSKAQAKTPKINKQADIMEKLGDIVLGGGKKVPWAELFYVSSRVPAESLIENVDDDLKREVRAWRACAETLRVPCGPNAARRGVHEPCSRCALAQGPECLTRALCLAVGLCRQLAFYDIALAGVKDCQEMCKAANIPYERPKDYYAEMVKTDEHMLKVCVSLPLELLIRLGTVLCSHLLSCCCRCCCCCCSRVSAQVKRQLLEQAAKVEASEMRRKQRDAKKYGKALQTERRLEKEKRKHDDLAEITKWRKNKPAGEADRYLSRCVCLMATPSVLDLGCSQALTTHWTGCREKDEALFEMAASKIPKKKGLHEFVAQKTGRRDPDESGPTKSAKRLVAAVRKQTHAKHLHTNIHVRASTTFCLYSETSMGQPHP